MLALGTSLFSDQVVLNDVADQPSHGLFQIPTVPFD